MGSGAGTNRTFHPHEPPGSLYIELKKNKTAHAVDTPTSGREYRYPVGSKRPDSDGDLTVPNFYVNNDGQLNLDRENVSNENESRVAVRMKFQDKLFRHPPIIRRASASLACIFRQFVAFARSSSRIARSCTATSSASASALRI